jgi:2-polyprenyl-6-methoxyphenol hydroxylase-like FAD-dependent oxidoreductase
MNAATRSGWDVLIVGAGVGGAALALALANRYPVRVLVVDRRQGPGNINRGDSLLPAVTQHLQAWGALPEVYAAGARPISRMQVFHHRGGFLFEVPLSLTGAPDPATESAPAPYLILPHPEIERVLLQTACEKAERRIEVRYGCKVVKLLHEGETGGRVIGAVLAHAGGSEEVRARLVVGADGKSSTVRAALELAVEYSPYDHSYFITEVARPLGYKDALRIELHPEGSILVVPQGPDRVGLGVLVRKRDTDLFRSGSLANKLSAIARRSPLFSGLEPSGMGADKSPGAHLYSLYRGHAARYAARGAVLLGDAIHVTNPTAGQGMTMAIEDAEALARHVGPVLTAGASFAAVQASLLCYQGERFPKNQAQIRWSHWLSRFYALHGELGDRLRHQVFRLGGTRLGQRIQHRIWAQLATRNRRAA